MKPYGVPREALRGYDIGTMIDTGKIGGTHASRRRRKKVWKAKARREGRIK